MPSGCSSRIISPSDATFPPTRPTSASPTSPNHRTKRMRMPPEGKMRIRAAARQPRSSSGQDDALDAGEGLVVRRLRGAEGKARVAAEPRGPVAAALAGVHVEELARHGDDLLLEGGAEEAHAVVERRRQALEVAPDVEGSLRRTVCADAQAVEALEHPVALVAEGGVDGQGLLPDQLLVEKGNGRALQRPRAAAVEEGAGAGHRLDHLGGRHRPGDAPARVAPVLGQAVEDDDGIAVHVLHVAGGALDGELAGAARPDIVRVELVDEQGAVELARGAHPALQLVAVDELAGGVAGVAEEQRGEAAALDLLGVV